jgi:hypothetical protein
MDFSFSATGLVGLKGNTPSIPPDGGDIGSHDMGSQNGISDVTAPFGCLVGVFLGPEQPLDPAPVPLDFETSQARNYHVLPSDLPGGVLTIQQVFYIGNGTGIEGGTSFSQHVIAPAGASRLYLGIMDRCNWDDNTGGFLVTVTIADEGGTSLPPCRGVAAGSAFNQMDPTILSDGSSDGAFVLWHEEEQDGSHILAQHIQTSGEVDPAWPVLGKWLNQPASGLCPNGVSIQSTPAGLNGAVVAWEAQVNGVSKVFVQEFDIVNGRIVFPWGPSAHRLSDSDSDQHHVRIAVGGTDRYLLVWQQRDLESNSTFDIYSVLVNARTGQTSLASVCSASGDQLNPEITSPPSAVGVEALVVWEDRRQDKIQAYMNGFHEGAWIWGMSGMPVGKASWGGTTPFINWPGLSTEGGIISWIDNGPRASRIVVQKLDVTSGTPHAGWIKSFAIDKDQKGSLHLTYAANQSGLGRGSVISWHDLWLEVGEKSKKLYPIIRAQRVSLDGALGGDNWQRDGSIIEDAISPSATSDGFKRFHQSLPYFIWQGTIGTSPVQIQTISGDGTVGGAGWPNTVCKLFGEQRSPAVLSIQQGLIAVWQSGCDTDNWRLWYQKTLVP